jgi:tetratricopeptide (TPR) repeat protein
MILAGCNGTATAQVAATPFNDSLFAAPSQPIRAEDVFARSAAMKHYLSTDIAAELHTLGDQRGLFDALYRRDQLQLGYDSTMTRTASEAFASRTGNCLSLAILTAALAKELGLSVRFHRVFVDEAWNRSGGLDVLDEHVNVTLGAKPVVGTGGQMTLTRLTVDFVPRDKLRQRRTREVSEDTIIAMYMSNRAAESLARHQVDDAYWFARAAISQDPRLLTAYNTLGVVYKQHGNLADAERVFAQVLEIEPDNTIAMANRVSVLAAMGNKSEAKILAERLRQIRPFPPFHFYEMGRLAMERGELANAKALFIKEIQRDAYYDKSHFWLAQVYYRLGDVANARKQLAIAEQTGGTRQDRDLYSAKLAWLTSVSDSAH